MSKPFAETTMNQQPIKPSTVRARTVVRPGIEPPLWIDLSVLLSLVAAIAGWTIWTMH
jgi:hypothetical protein